MKTKIQNKSDFLNESFYSIVRGIFISKNEDYLEQRRKAGVYQGIKFYIKKNMKIETKKKRFCIHADFTLYKQFYSLLYLDSDRTLSSV